MPTVLIIGPFRFHFYSNERGEPAHIHVAFEEFDAKFWLEPVALARNRGIPAHRLREVEGLVRANARLLKEKFDEFHNA